MWSLFRLSTLSLSMIMLAGCSEPKIDTSSMPAAVVSVEKVRESLPTYKRDEFDQALTIMAMSSFSGIDILNPRPMNAAEIAESANAYMHGLTGDEAIEKANEMLRNRRARERNQALAILSRLEEKQANAKHDRQQRERITIDSADFYMSTSPYGALEPIIELEVTNGPDERIVELSLRGVVTSPNHEAPWVDESFYYVIPDGLEPGESAKWSLAPNRFGPWGNQDIPDNAELAITIESVHGDDGNALWDSAPLSERQRERLDELRDEYGAIAEHSLE
ncbi:DUF6694 family lipoprotein [Halomonas sp. hl-4]|uniref:DUF6694 family lipoprotein n=1 Tax=Halomonas sp. hl-4 TaxID=1761789 RepID=UPI000BBF7505|nr:DUF6694 family lipoprotein [Halomonas sp. hl-4]SNY96541.1 hypothetical protein SAMN04488142_1081 [Halomonas sp. hl-4]